MTIKNNTCYPLYAASFNPLIPLYPVLIYSNQTRNPNLKLNLNLNPNPVIGKNDNQLKKPKKQVKAKKLTKRNLLNYLTFPENKVNKFDKVENWLKTHPKEFVH